MQYFSLDLAELIPQLFLHHEQLLFYAPLIGYVMTVNQIKVLMA
jgi:hypothetical protein